MTTYKVAVLDDYQGFANPAFGKLGSQYEVSYLKETLLPYGRSDTPQSVKDQLIKRLESFDIISTTRERTPFPAELINKLPKLKFLLTTGYRNAAIDMAACKARGIPVSGAVDPTRNVVGTTGVDSTTQHCVALILALARNIAQDDSVVKSGGWQTSFATSVAGKTLGIVGLGRLGVNVARIMHVAFGMKIIAWSTNLTQEAADDKARGVGLPVENTAANGDKTFKVVSKEELFSTSDFVSLHVVLSDRSRGIVSGQDLSQMKPSSFLINTSRGPLIVEKDLLEVVKAGRIRGVALDVFDTEPLPADSEWRNPNWGKDGTSATSRVLITPHMGYVEESTMRSWYEQQVENIVRWEKGETLAHVLN